jgi:DNA-binding ferritin-like protein
MLLDEHGEQIFAMTDVMAERARKIGGSTLRSSATFHDSSAYKTTTKNE